MRPFHRPDHGSVEGNPERSRVTIGSAMDEGLQAWPDEHGRGPGAELRREAERSLRAEQGQHQVK